MGFKFNAYTWLRQDLPIVSSKIKRNQLRFVAWWCQWWKYMAHNPCSTSNMSTNWGCPAESRVAWWMNSLGISLLLIQSLSQSASMLVVLTSFPYMFIDVYRISSCETMWNSFSEELSSIPGLMNSKKITGTFATPAKRLFLWCDIWNVKSAVCGCRFFHSSEFVQNQ